ncbi:MAG TPA: response regulator [Polyangia bacterium]
MSPAGEILIVDDSLTVRMDLADAFQDAGFRARACSTLAEARAALDGAPPSPGAVSDAGAHAELAGPSPEPRVALVILDLLLPDGDGLSLLREIRASPSTAEVPVLMLSSDADVRDRVRGLQTGATDYVGKPYDRGHVVSRARELLGPPPAPSPAAATILVIDDSATYRSELRRALEAAGYAVLVATNGEDGLKAASDHRPTGIIVDGVMPGIDGHTVVRRLRLDAALRGTPCVLLTASEAAGNELQALEAGADAFVRKEEDLEIVLARLAAVLRPAADGRVIPASLLAPKRILAADDSPTFLHELAGMLRGEGYDVVLARSGEEVLEMLSAQPVDCILLDLVMPGLGGRETCQRIKSTPETRDIPLILVSSLEDRATLLDGLAAGADDYVSKAGGFEVLKARVRAQLRRKQVEDENRRVREELMRGELAAAEARAARAVAEAKAALLDELRRKNRELETFSYSVSHDLRAPLRAIDGFSRALLDDYAPCLDERGQRYLTRIRAAAQRMGELIDDLLQLSRVARSDLALQTTDLSDVVRTVVAELERQQPEHHPDVTIAAGVTALADRRLIRVVFENLLGNAWKFTKKTAAPRVEFGREERDGRDAYFVRDNGAGFDMAFAANLFAPFQRLHSEADFPGTGIGLATVYRIIDRHGGRVWAEGIVGQGATIYFTLSPPSGGDRT